MRQGTCCCGLDLHGIKKLNRSFNNSFCSFRPLMHDELNLARGFCISRNKVPLLVFVLLLVIQVHFGDDLVGWLFVFLTSSSATWLC